MISKPTGTVLRTADGFDLVVRREFKSPIEDVWASITEPERSARWFGTWRGKGGAGETIEVQWAYEEGQPWGEMTITACEPPRRLALTSKDEAGMWRLEVLLSRSGETTELRLIHHMDDTTQAGDNGPGWEYYMDMLTAARAGDPLPSWEGYDEAMRSHFEAEAAKAEQGP